MSAPKAPSASNSEAPEDPRGARPVTAQPPASSPVWPVGPVIPGVLVGTGDPGGSAVTAAGVLRSASAVPPKAPRLTRAPLGVGSSPTASAGSPWSVEACGPVKR